MKELEIIDSIRDIIPRYSPHILKVGMGDDCAVCPRDEVWDTLLKTDVVVSGIHFYPEESPLRIGWKALARAVSDIAAMGGIPEYCLVTLLSGDELTKEYVQSLYKGILACADKYGIAIAGGETSQLSHSGIVVNISLVGKVEKGRALVRYRASPGEWIFVTGELGNSFRSKHHLNFLPRIGEGRFLNEKYYATSMMDISDGLSKDLVMLSEASGVGFVLAEDALPLREGADILMALNEGEDYELLFTVEDDLRSDLEQEWKEVFPNTRLSCIGVMTPQSENFVIRQDGSEYPFQLGRGWEHFNH